MALYNEVATGLPSRHLLAGQPCCCWHHGIFKNKDGIVYMLICSPHIFLRPVGLL